MPSFSPRVKSQPTPYPILVRDSPRFPSLSNHFLIRWHHAQPRRLHRRTCC